MSKKKLRRARGRGKPVVVGLVEVVGAADLARHFRERLKSREWWALVSVGGAGREQLQGIEEAHFSGEAGKDYEAFLLVTPTSPVVLFFALKSRLSAAELARRVGVAEADLRQRDTIFLGTPEQEDLARAVSRDLDCLLWSEAAGRN